MGRASRRKQSRTDDATKDLPAPIAGGPEAPLIVVGGCPRSGTTLLRLMLDSHARIACGPEFKVLNLIAGNAVRMMQVHAPTLEGVYALEREQIIRSFGDQAVALLEPWRRRAGKARIAEKTPQNVHAFTVLAEMLPESPFIHLIRDGRDVVRSLLRQSWSDPATGRPVPYCADPVEAAKYWVKCVRDGRRMADGPHAARYVEVRYEDLATDPEATMRTLLDRIGESWDPAVLAHHERDHAMPESEAGSHGDALSRPVNRGAIGRWRDEWTETDRSAVERVAGALLRELGYEA